MHLRQVKQLAKAVLSLPPFVMAHRRIYEGEFSSGKLHQAFRGVFSSFSEAQASVPTSALRGYDNAEAASFYRERPIFPEDYGVLFWLRSLLRPGMKVFDYGGHAGGMFDAFRPLLPLPPGVTWTIYDVPAVVSAGMQMNASRSEPRPTFTTDWNIAANTDVLLASGSLQYVDEHLAARLARLPRLPSHVIVNQLPLHDDLEFVTLQGIGGVYCPYWVFRRTNFRESLERLGYQMVDAWSNPNKGCHIPTYPRHLVRAYSGAYFRLNP